MKALCTFLFLAIGILNAQQATLTAEDLKALQGNWTGDLTYIDYNSGEPYTMPCNIVVTKTKDENELHVAYTYPNEPTANSSSTFKLAKNGTVLNKKPIAAINRKDNGLTEVFCEYEGRDGNDNKEATIRSYYTIGDEVLKIGKFVKFKGTDEWIKRNEYSFRKAY